MWRPHLKHIEMKHPACCTAAQKPFSDLQDFLYLTRCACARGAPQLFHAISRRTGRRHVHHVIDSRSVWSMKKIANENSSTCTVHSTFLSTNFAWFTKNRFLIRFTANFQERLLLQERSAQLSIETSLQGACKAACTIGCTYAMTERKASPCSRLHEKR